MSLDTDRLTLACVATLLALSVVLGSAGCDPRGTGSLATTSFSNLSATTVTAPSSHPAARVSGPVTSRWPVGLVAVVLEHNDGISVVDAQGTIFREARSELATTTTGSGLFIEPPTYNVSPGGRFIAYHFRGEDVVVRSTLTGEILGRIAKHYGYPTDDDEYLQGLSQDGRYLALLTGGLHWHDPMAWDRWTPSTLTIADVTTGTRLVPQAIAAMISTKTDRYWYATGMTWLSDDRLLLSVGHYIGNSTYTEEGYLYDLRTDTLTLQPGVGRVNAESMGGAALIPQTTGYGVWRDGKIKPLPYPARWYYGGGVFSPDASRVASGLGARPENGVQPAAWQLFQEKDGVWVKASLLWPVSEAGHPMAVSSDNRTIWGLSWTERNTLVSLDAETGTLTNWFGPEDFTVDPKDAVIHWVIPK